MIASPLRYSVFAGLVLGGVALLAAQGARLGLLPALLLLPLAAWPAWLALAYPATVRRIDARSSLREGAEPWWAPVLGGALLRQVAAVPVALLAAGSLAGRILSEGWGALLWAAAAAGAVYACAAALSSGAAPLRAYARPLPALVAAPRLAAALLTGLWAGLAGLGSLGPGTLGQLVAAQPRYEGTSTLLAWGMDGMAVANGAGAWTGSWAEEAVGGVLPSLWRLAGAAAQFWLLALVMAGLLLPKGAGRRILRPSAAEEPPPVGPRRAGLAAFAATLLLLATVGLAARLEAWAGARQPPVALAEVPAPPVPGADGAGPALASAPDRPPAVRAPALPSPRDLREAVEAERLGDLTCPEGTIAGVEALDDGLRALLADQRDRIETAARRGFSAMRANVPAYLDWYYSLPAEYARTGHLLLGGIEAHLQEGLRASLDEGAPFAPLARAAEGLAGNPAAIERWRAERARLLGACGHLLAPDGLSVAYTAVAPDALRLAGPSVERLDLRLRLGGAGAAAAAGGVAGGILASTAAKLAMKEVFGLAVEAAGKFAAGKATGWLGGALAGLGGGAAAGSILPGVGTAAGAVVGGVVGAAGAWVATDYLLLKLEEEIAREDFEAEILAAIDEAEAEFLAGLGPAPQGN